MAKAAPTTGRYHAGNPAPLSVRKQAVAELTATNGKAELVAAVAEKYGVTSSAIYRWRSLLKGPQRRNKTLTDEQRRALVQAFVTARAAGENGDVVAERLGVARGQLYQWAKRYGDEIAAQPNGHQLEFDSEESSERGVDPATGRAVERFVSKQRARINGGPEAAPLVAPKALAKVTNGNGHHAPEVPLEVEVALLRARNMQLRRMVQSLQKIIAESVEAN
jgi:transposase-like protein